MDVELDIGGLDPAVVGENFIEGDTSICAGYFTDEEEMLVAPEEQGQGCYGSRFEKDGTVSGAYFGNCLKDFWLSADILIIRGHFLIYSDKKTKAVVWSPAEFFGLQRKPVLGRLSFRFTTILASHS